MYKRSQNFILRQYIKGTIWNCYYLTIFKLRKWVYHMITSNEKKLCLQNWTSQFGQISKNSRTHFLDTHMYMQTNKSDIECLSLLKTRKRAKAGTKRKSVRQDRFLFQYLRWESWNKETLSDIAKIIQWLDEVASV